ncbi:hypothetical protein CBM2626_A10122 [Cupriavidus taiwanensis]|nr:hypothetical protein CBM2626_A10122 [Cupriavidus taiwanensis]
MESSISRAWGIVVAGDISISRKHFSLICENICLILTIHALTPMNTATVRIGGFEPFERQCHHSGSGAMF